MNDLLENAKRNSKITLEEFFFEFYSKILEFEQETKIKENEGFFMIFTESEDLGNHIKLFARDIATLNDTTVYSVGATFIATKKFT